MRASSRRPGKAISCRAPTKRAGVPEILRQFSLDRLPPVPARHVDGCRHAQACRPKLAPWKRKLLTAMGSGGGGSIPNTCTESGGQYCSNQIGTHCGYTWEYWKDTGNGCMTNTSDGFSVNWSGINNLLGRKGLRPGSASHVVTYDADYQPNGNSYLCVYGWSQGPLAEYY